MILLKLLSLNSEVITPLRCMRLFTYQSCGFMPAANSLRHCYIGFAQFPGNPQGERWSIGPWKGTVTRSSSMWNKILIDISCVYPDCDKVSHAMPVPSPRRSWSHSPPVHVKPAPELQQAQTCTAWHQGTASASPGEGPASSTTSMDSGSRKSFL